MRPTEAQRQEVAIVLLTTSGSPRDQARLQGLPVAAFLSKFLNEAKIT